MNDVSKTYLSLQELAQYTSLSIKTLRKYLLQPANPLPHYRILGKILVKREEFDAWIERYRIAQQAVDLNRLVNGVLADLQSRSKSR